MFDDDEPPLRGEFLSSVCAALGRNAIGSIKSAPVDIPDPLDFTASKKPPRTVRRWPMTKIKKGA